MKNQRILAEAFALFREPEEDEPDDNFLIDEDGNFLTDEDGNILTG